MQLLKSGPVDPKFQFPMAACVYVCVRVSVHKSLLSSISVLHRNDGITYPLSAPQISIYTFTKYSLCCHSQQTEIRVRKAHRAG